MGLGDKRSVGGMEYTSLLFIIVVVCYISVHYEQLFRACSNQYQGEGPTGILLVYPQHCLHLLEVLTVSYSACVYVCACVYVYTCVRTYLHTCVSLFAHVFVCMWMNHHTNHFIFCVLVGTIRITDGSCEGLGQAG